MTQENKELLLRDLSARLPYGIKVHIKGEYHKHHEVEEIDISDECVRYFENFHLYEEEITNCRLYLRPMSSMTEEEKMHFWCLNHNPNTGVDFMTHAPELIDWLNKNHFDYRGLIEKGLALEAPSGMYKLKEE